MCNRNPRMAVNRVAANTDQSEAEARLASDGPNELVRPSLETCILST